MNARPGDFIIIRRARPMALLTRHVLIVFQVAGAAVLGCAVWFYVSLWFSLGAP